MYNMRYTAVLMDIKALLNCVEGTLETIEVYGVDFFLDYCKQTDTAIIANIRDMCKNPEEVADYNDYFGTRYTAKELEKFLIRCETMLPHMDYSEDGFAECSSMLKVLFYDNPNFFQELGDAKMINLHNDLMEKFGNLDKENESSID